MKLSPHQLLLVTYQFPFATGESFVEDELKVLAQYFEKIYVFPARACFNRKWLTEIRRQTPDRKLPENCQIILAEENTLARRLRAAAWYSKLIYHSFRAVRPRLTNLAAMIEMNKDAAKAGLFLSALHDAYRLHPELEMPRLAYCYWKTEAAIAFSLLTKMNLTERGFISRCHGGDLYYNLPKNLQRPFDLFVAEYGQLFMPVSQVGADHLVEHGFAKEKVEVHRLGIELPETLSQSSADGIWRIASCSNVINIKRVALIAETLAQINHPFEWTHFGDGNEMSQVQSVVEKFPSHGRATLKGSRPRAEIFQFFSQQPVDLFINLSVTEGVPVSVMEALAYGIPVVATDAGGTRELIDCQVGRLIPIAVTAEQVAEAIVQVCSNVSADKRLAARQRAESLCDGRRNFARFGDRLLVLANEKAAR